MLAQRVRRWLNLKSTLPRHLVFSGRAYYKVIKSDVLWGEYQNYRFSLIILFIVGLQLIPLLIQEH